LFPGVAIFFPSKSSSASAARSTFIVVAITLPFCQVVAVTILFSLHTIIAPSWQLAAVVDLRLRQVIWSSSSHSVIIVSAVAQWQSRCVQRHPVQIASLPAVCHGGCQILLLSAQSCTSCTRPHHPVTDFGLFCPVMLHLEGDQSTFSPLLQSVGVLFMLGRDNLTSHHLHFGPGTWASI
jgi:hypothetical protein